jgi:lipoprotein-anchoring transpeptidase ErfK/SrfK
MNAFLLQYRIPLLAGGVLAIGGVILCSAFFPNVFLHPKLTPLAAVAAALPLGLEGAPAPSSSYIEIENSCSIHFEGTCVVARSAPATTSPAIAKLRDGIVLAVSPTTTADSSGRIWYHVIFDEAVRYPERLSSEWYVAADNVRAFQDSGTETLAADDTAPTTTEKHIIVKRSEQMLYAYDGNRLFLKTPVSTGLELTPTPRGIFHIYKKTPSRYMQGPLPGISDQYYDLPGVPWNLYFTYQGGAIHGAYWHNSFGEEWSHGCVNLPLETAHTLYDWADLGTEVTVED